MKYERICRWMSPRRAAGPYLSNAILRDRFILRDVQTLLEAVVEIGRTFMRSSATLAVRRWGQRYSEQQSG